MEYAARRVRPRVILHSDMNCFYASVECQARPELRELPVAVGGDEEARHGIVLAANRNAKRWGVRTAEALWQARKKCPDLVVVPPDYRLYLKVSRLARAIYLDYTDLVEPFGPDEAWLDVTGSVGLWGGDPAVASELIAREISERVKAELGVTVSVGVSWNKIFAKFGSDYRKPDAITAVTPDNYRSIVWDAAARELLYVGPATARKLHSSGIDTVGGIAQASDALLVRRLGKTGLALKAFALGLDATPVRAYDAVRGDVDRLVKSYGNGLTAPHDIVCARDARALAWMLSESVAQRLREGRARARTVAVGVRSADDLLFRSRQTTLPLATNITSEIGRTAWTLMEQVQTFNDKHPVRGLHVRASGLVPATNPGQLMLFDAYPDRAGAERLDDAIDGLRTRFGNRCVMRGIELTDASLAGVDVEADNIVHPVSFFG